ncbi:MAG: homoserine kinase [Gammaproteobacteria bacterium]
MSVHTPLTADDISDLLLAYDLGQLVNYQGITAGVTNTIYRIETSSGCYILTLFETLTAEQLPVYLALNQHLAQHAIPCAPAIADQQQQLLHCLHNKPVIIMPLLAGETLTITDRKHCHAIGLMLAQLHQAGQTFQHKIPNQRAWPWYQQTYQTVLTKLTTEQQRLLTSEMNFQQQQTWQHLPQGLIHADLFRDNVLFNHYQITGVLDFYYACHDYWLLDIATTINDWCLNTSGTIDPQYMQDLIDAYQTQRMLTEAEWAQLPAMLRRAALRFWLSRLHDYYCVTHSAAIHVHDPAEFERILCFHRQA